jgi:acyl-CoA synthetase (AMP-forming)/AMP-acid ligase II
LYEFRCPDPRPFLNANQPFPISPRNSAAGIFQLLRASSCHRIIATCVTLAPLLAGLKKHIAGADPDFILDIEEMPPLGQIYPNLDTETPDCPFQTYPTQISPVQLDKIGLYFHSSGSTGFSKAVPLTHRVLAHSLTFRSVCRIHCVFF